MSDIEGYCSCGHHKSNQCDLCISLMAEDDELESPVKEVGQAIRAVFAAMDDLIVLANQEATRSLVCDERRAIGQLMTRCEVLCSFALAAKPGPTLVRQRAS